MNNAINKQCKVGTAYSPRLKTDVLYSLECGSFNYNEYFDSNVKLIQNEYLCNSKTWKQFVRQFKEEGDGKTLEWRGEFWGKMMRGAVFTYKYTKDEALYNVLAETVKDLISSKQHDGRISSYNRDVEFKGWDMWSRKYVLLGFQYFLEICNDNALKEEIIKTMCDHADYILKYVGREEDGKIPVTKTSDAWLGLNSSSILEPFVRLYNITGEQKYFDFATHIVACGGVSEGNIFEMAYEDKIEPYQYTTNKAYEMMSCFEGLLEYYRVSGIEKYKQAAIRFAKRVIDSDITIIGCAGCTHELFDNSAKTQLNLKYSGVVQETCVTVTWMKYCYQLLCLTGDPIFAEQIEKSAYNAMSGSVNNNKIENLLSGFPYDSYSPLLYSTRGRQNAGYMMMDEGPYGCCACIGSAGTSLIPLSSVMLSKDGVYVNLYIPGTISTETPTGNKLVLNIDTEYPKNGNIKVKVSGVFGEKMVLAFRIPEFSKNSNVSVNGVSVGEISTGYLKIEREWNNEDIVDIELDVRVRTFRCEGIEGSGHKHVALIKGPVVLARDARLGEKIDTIVDILENKDGCVDVLPSKTAGFYTNMEYKVPLKDGSYITMIDYASAGKTWTHESQMTAWMATENYWNVDLTKPIKLASRNTSNKHSLYLGEDNVLVSDMKGQKYDYFTLEKVDDDLYRIKAKDGRYLTVLGDDIKDNPTFEEKIEADCQKWKIENVVQNRFFIISAKNRCNLHERYGTPFFRLYALNAGSDQKYATQNKYINVLANALFEITN